MEKTTERPGKDKSNTAKKTMNSILDAKQAFAVPGEDSIIDCINPETGKSWIKGETLEQIRLRYDPLAEIVNIDEFCAQKGMRQDSAIKWVEISEDHYWAMLEVLPPAAQKAGGFLVGEPTDHHAVTGAPRFSAFIKRGGKHFESSRPLTRKEFATA